MSCRYHHPLVEGFAEQVHTPGGVRSLVENSHLISWICSGNWKEMGMMLVGPQQS